MRAVFDVNVLVRACLGSSPINALLERCALGESLLLTNELLVDEFAATTRKPRLLTKIDLDTYDDILALLATSGEEIGVNPPFPACRDEDDRYLLGMAQPGGADYLVSLDQDLLSPGTVGNCRIVTPGEVGSILGLQHE